MLRKPIILILTSRDEIDCESKKIKEAVLKTGTHNVVILSDDQYGSAAKMSRLDKLMDAGKEYQYMLEKKDKSRQVLKDKFRLKSLSKRVNRINNAVRRYRPEFILTLTPYAHHSAAEAKRRAKFDKQIIYLMPSFTLDKRQYDDATNVFIVENQDIKSELVHNGIYSKNIMTMGLPFEIVKRTPIEIASAKQEFGLPKTKTVFLNVASKKIRDEVFSLLLDQGGIINIVVYCEDPKEIAALRERSSHVPDVTVIIVAKEDLFDEYLSVCDIAITHYDASVIYKCMKLGLPAITFGEGEHTAKEINYLVSKGLVLRAKENIETIALLYKLLQSETAVAIAMAQERWVEFSSLENIANFLVSYIAV